MGPFQLWAVCGYDLAAFTAGGLLINPSVVTASKLKTTMNISDRLADLHLTLTGLKIRKNILYSTFITFFIKMFAM